MGKIYLRGFTSDHKRALRAAAIVFFWLFVARIAGALKEIAVAYRYGTGPTIDGYLLVFNLTYWFSTAIDSVLMYALVPLLSRLHSAGCPQSLSEFKRELLGAAFLVSCALYPIIIVGLLWLMYSGILHLTPATMEAARLSTFLLPIGVIFSFLSTVLFVWSVARERHLSSLADAMPALGIGTAVVLSPYADIQTLIIGTLAGFMLRWLFLTSVSGAPLKTLIPRLTFQSALWRDFVRGVSLVAIAQSILVATNFVDTFFAAQRGEGALAIYNYAYRVVSLVLSLLAMPISRSLLPIFSRQQTEVDRTTRFDFVHRIVWSAVGVGAFFTAVGWIVSGTAIQLIFERGAFTAQDTAAVSSVFRALLVQVPFYVGWIVLFNWHASQHAHRVILTASIFTLLTKIVSAWLLSTLYGLEGLALSTTMMYLLGLGYTLAAAYVWKRRREA